MSRDRFGRPDFQRLLRYRVEGRLLDWGKLNLARLEIEDGWSGGNLVLIRFERHVQAMRATESSAYVTTRKTGNKLKSGSTFNDHYGLLTSLDEATKQAMEFIETLSVEPGGPLIVEIETKVEDSPVIDAPEHLKPRFGGGQYFLPASDEWLLDDEKAERWLEICNGEPGDENTVARFAPENQPNRLSAKGLFRNVTTFSSDWSPEQVAATQEDLKALVNAN